MPCALCLADAPLRLSHIVPEFLHRDMYDEKHRFFGLSSTPEKAIRQFQKGLREELLCGKCEQTLAGYERYGSRVLYHDSLDGTLIGNVVGLRSLDYRSLKLFFLSLLWRFGVTSLEIFQSTKLGPHQEELRRMIHEGDPGEALKYPCLLSAVMFNRKHVSDLIVPPSVGRVEGQRVWQIIVGGFLMSFFVVSHNPPASLHALFLQEDGTFNMQIREMREIDFLYEFTREMAIAQRQRVLARQENQQDR